MVRRAAKLNVAMNSIFPAVEPFICDLKTAIRKVFCVKKPTVQSEEWTICQNHLCFLVQKERREQRAPC